MGTGSSAVEAAIAEATPESLKETVAALSAEDKKKLAEALAQIAPACPHAKQAGSGGGGGCPFAQIVKATAGAVAPNVPAIVDDFYTRLFKEHPETKAFFNPANQFGQPPKQRDALANAVVAYATNIEDLTPLLGAVEIIAHRHVALTVQPPHYEVVHKRLMESIGHVLGDVVTPEIGTGWSDAVLALAKILIEKEEELYTMAKDRAGGWRGAKDFKLARKREVTSTCMEFTFEAADGAEPIDFTPGQYLTVHLKKEGATPRHYTVTSKPGEAFLQCCVKKIEGGFVSGALHELAEGDVVGLSPPFGTYKLTDKPIVLVSAGIGVTPMKSFLGAAADRVRLAVHVDRSEADHPFREDFSGVPTHFHYTKDSGRLAASALVEGPLQPHLQECDFYLCGPGGWMKDVKVALEAGGASVHATRFGAELA